MTNEVTDAPEVFLAEKHKWSLIISAVKHMQFEIKIILFLRNDKYTIV